MKKLFKLYDPKLCHLIIYRATSIIAVGLLLALLWDRFLRSPQLSLVRDGFFTAGLICLFYAWIAYLGLDGLSAEKLFKTDLVKTKKKRTVFKAGDMADFVDEHIPRMEELSRDQQRLVKLASGLLSGAFFMIPSIASLISWYLG